MPNIQLEIRHQENPKHATAAWFVQGSDSEQWLAEIARWQVEHHQLRLIPISSNRTLLSPESTRQSLGVLVFSVGSQSLNRLLGVATASKYGCLCERLFLPCDGALYPPMNQQEIQDLLLPDNRYIWHPAAGLIVASPLEVYRVSDLLAAKPSGQSDWGLAQPGLFLETRLRSLSLDQPLEMTPETVLSDGRDDIGEQSKDLKGLAPFSDEPKPTQISQATDSLTKAFAEMIQHATSWAPGNAQQRTWINGIEDWANGKLAGISERLEKQRFKELFRLQKMLEDDPDQGLKYALPLNSDSLHRGTAGPASQLGRRNVDFSLNGIRGGGRADFWDMPNELRNQLNRRYRELAEREMRLGRYRRAAYIFGELLADMNAAARTLESGKHYREAAVVYRKKLKLDNEAARCLEQGGLWTEAIELYDELEQFEKGGDLYAKLDNHEQSQSYYQKACDSARENEDLLDTARIEHEKLKDVDAAIETLKSGWPRHSQALDCFKKTFQIMAATGKHESANQWLTIVSDGYLVNNNFSLTVDAISALANSYPNQSTRDLAKDKTYQIVSKAIAEGRVSDVDSLLRSVAKLHPSDELLGRDCRRFKLENSIPTRKSPAGLLQNDRLQQIKKVETVKLQKGFEWLNAIGFDGGFLVVGRKDVKAKVLRLSSSSKMSEFDFSLSAATTSNFLLATGKNHSTAVVHLPLDHRFASRQLFAQDKLNNLKVNRRFSIDSLTLGITEGAFGQWETIRIHDKQFILDTVAENGDLTSSRPVPQNFLVQYPELPVPMFCDGSKTYIAVGSQLLTSKGASPMEAMDLPDPAIGMVGSVRGVSTHIALTFEFGFRILWESYGPNLSGLMCETMSRPRLLFTRTGHLIAADDDQCEVYRTVQGEFKLVAKIWIKGCRALMRTKESAGFALLNSAGEIEVYRIPLKQ